MKPTIATAIEMQPVLFKVIEWARKNGKKVQEIDNDDIFEALFD